jgi:pectin methylesterase-like acyl-CoA thioesterase
MRSAGLVAVVLVTAASLVGCSQSPSGDKPTASPSASAATPTASPTPTASATPTASFVPNGSAKDNKPFFDKVNAALFAANSSANGRDIIDNLVKSGFDKSAMQVTPDTTSIGGRVDAILFSVRIGKFCLLGQHGSAYNSAVEAALANGTCLVGKTRPIDW